MPLAASDLFVALGQPTRMSIVELLAARGALSASEISGEFTSTPSAISQHLRALREAGLVTVEKRAQQRVYGLDTATMARAEQWIGERRRSWEQRLDALAAFAADRARGAGQEGGGGGR